MGRNFSTLVSFFWVLSFLFCEFLEAFISTLCPVFGFWVFLRFREDSPLRLIILRFSVYFAIFGEVHFYTFVSVRVSGFDFATLVGVHFNTLISLASVAIFLESSLLHFDHLLNFWVFAILRISGKDHFYTLIVFWVWGFCNFAILQLLRKLNFRTSVSFLSFEFSILQFRPET